MPRKLPPFLHREITRHKRPVWYFRRGKGPRVRIPGEFNSVEFLAAYDAALNGRPPCASGPCSRDVRVGSGVLSPVAGMGRPKPRYAAPARQHLQAYRGRARRVEAHATGSAATLQRAGTSALLRLRRLECSSRPCAGFFGWAVEAGLRRRRIRPMASRWSRLPQRASSLGQTVTWPPIAPIGRLGTHQRVAFEVLRETGLRRGDAVRVGRQHVRNGVIRLATEKTGEHVSIAISDVLAAALAAGPVGHMTFIVGAGGKPLVKEGFTNMFRIWALAAGVNKPPHGLRKAAATADALGRIQRRRVVGEVRMDGPPDGEPLHARGQPGASVASCG